MRRVTALLVILAALWLTPQTAAQDVADPQTTPPPTYVVRPGDTLAGIAERYGLTLAALSRANGIQNPRQLYPGQTLSLSPAVGAPGTVHCLSWGEDLVALSRAAGVAPLALAHINALLLPTGLRVGYCLRLPLSIPVRVVPPTEGATWAAAPRIGASLRYGARLWDVLWLNPLPHIVMQPLLVPETASATEASPRGAGLLPDLVLSLSLSAQPVDRGETVAIVLETAEPVRCTLSYLGQTESCVGSAEPSRSWLGLAGLSPLLDPGVYTLTLALTTSEGGEGVVPVPILVSAGRYDYERIDLPPDRQSLLDPQRSQAERAKIAALRLLRSPVRYWSYPFMRPVDAAITSYFGSRRSYGHGFGNYHAGSDFDGQGGEPVLAPADGVVILAEPLVVRGNAILVDHGWGVVSGFWHLSEFAVEVGDRVSRGQRIGALGNTGLSTGAHLHWELWVNGSAVNALSWLEPDGPAAMLGKKP
ncbi:MAG: peptidoglycan DD-metalloendopeptidase family protein [Anaerolineae bacterium]|nr:peptidoglycan DD-metalloendopeptidase family protein [Anaerolineae bacterium]